MNKQTKNHCRIQQGTNDRVQAGTDSSLGHFVRSNNAGQYTVHIFLFHFKAV